MGTRSASVVDVRRLFVRFILLVVLPAVGLVGFGVVAISNERAVVEQRFNQEYTGRLRLLAAHLAGALESEAATLADGGEPGPLVKFRFEIADTDVRSRPPVAPPVSDALAAALRASAPADGSLALVPVPTGPARGLYAVRARGRSLEGLAFSETGLAASVEARAKDAFPADPAHFALEGPREPEAASSNPMRRLLDEITAERGGLSLPLPAPLAEWRIVAKLPSTDPVSTALWRNRTVYIVALALFYAVIAIGVVLTLRGIVREARLSRAKTDFVSNISHELRTPLTSIRMFAEMLQLGRVRSPQEQQECISFIARESERLSVLVERTLDWARLEAGRRAYERREIAPRALVDGVVATFRSHQALAKDALTVEYSDPLPAVEGDAEALGQVLLNLLENAVKYTLEEKRIRVRVRREGRRVRFEVEDNGIGIARRDLKRIFERFYRADDLLARRTEGSGLGLSIARLIVHAHGGRLRVKSRPGHGSTFAMELPARVPGPGAPETEGRSAA